MVQFSISVLLDRTQSIALVKITCSFEVSTDETDFPQNSKTYDFSGKNPLSVAKIFRKRSESKMKLVFPQY
jgi:hypothetical protein